MLKHLEDIAPSNANDDYLPLWLIAIDDDTYVNPITGVATTKLSKTVTTPGGDTVALTAGDIDEAVSGLLTNGLAAGDVNGESVPAGFSRIDAFRVGVLGDEGRCYKRFP